MASIALPSKMIRLLVALACSAVLALPSQSRAAGPGSQSVTIETGSGQLLKLAGRATNVFAADPKVAEVRPASPNTLFVFGVAPGHTTIVAIGASGNAVGQYVVDVVPSSYATRAAREMLGGSDQLDGMRMQQGQDSITLRGEAASPVAAQEAVVAAQDALGKDGRVFDRMRVNGSIQVNLRVRIAEMSRTLTRELGINWQSVNALGTDAAIGVSVVAPIATLAASQSVINIVSHFGSGGTSGALDTVIDALSQDQLVHMLAEPNLTTMSGEPASFLAGGEFPIPIATQENTITVDFKQYGISLSFVPTVLANGQISLHVRPEVSQLTDQGAVSLANGSSVIKIPALTVRRVDTTVELGSGQSFAIAGLLQDTTTSGGAGLPFLGDLPILGALFRSDSFQRNQSELVIVVTPYIVRPASTPTALQLPTDDWQPPNDLERILLLRQTGRNQVAAMQPAAGAPIPIHIPGDAGFVVE